MSAGLAAEVREELAALRADGALKEMREIASPQGPEVRFADGAEAICLCSNDYLGLAADPQVVAAAAAGLHEYGAGTASVRFICGLFTPHVELERDLAAFLGTERAVTYVSCWNANQALLDTLCDERTWVLSDELNHASIIDGIRLARPGGKAIYAHADVAALERELEVVPDGCRCLVVTDGVFSMEGDLAPLPEIVALCEAHEATLVVDDSHGLGVLGPTGRGTAEHFGLADRVDITTGTLGKALGGAAGGFVAAGEEVCSILEQRSRAQLFSNGLPQSVACGARAALGVLRDDPTRLGRLRANVDRFRTGVSAAGLEPLEGESAIVPIIVGETRDAIAISEALLERGVFAIGFGYPVVPEGAARVRVQLSAAHSDEQIDRAVASFAAVAAERGLV
ncbi:MAG TPA: aminotransferase class I/II-fold pyridoxal phosphate-dependent enzyme [Solirubrobacterales bacterium]|nr:aminotransferase class I/II-fold pyridoxal phosphate-dependent enzyme [Solirubrobacterales bacterium]